METPPSGFIKINVDGVASNDGRPSSIGVIIRDNQGSSIAASSRVLPSPFPAKITKVLALQEGVLLASKMGLANIIFESNALSIIQEINKISVGGEFGHIIQNIRGLSSSFSWCLFQHLKWDGNRVAHELGKAARNSSVSQVWRGVIPSFVEHFILEDHGL